MTARLEARAVTYLVNGSAILVETSLVLPESGTVAIIGPNGAGKSTLVKALCGIVAPTRGEVLLGGRPILALPARERAGVIGYMPQQFEPHWDLSVAELLRLGAERTGGAVSDGRIDELAARYELRGFLRRRWRTLSGGERARALLATVLAVDPPILLADEPGASLDIRHRLDLVKSLVARGRGHLSVVVMHDLDLALRHFDRVVLMQAGRIASEAPARALRDDPRLDGIFGVRFERTMVGGAPTVQVVEAS